MKSLIKGTFLLEKFPGKGGWTYARLPEIEPDKNSPFGWRRVRGTIDSHEISAYHLMPMGNGELFLPVNAQIRKKIKKEAGDTIEVELYRDDLPTEIPQELLAIINDERDLADNFQLYTDSEKKAFVDLIYAAKHEETKARRMAKVLQCIAIKETLFGIVKKN